MKKIFKIVFKPCKKDTIEPMRVVNIQEYGVNGL